jgi:DNA-binding NarL/FixJ family response regulator
MLIVEDHDLVRQSLSLLMARRYDFEVVGEAATAAEAMEKVAELEPDIVVIDAQLPDRSGIEASRDIRNRYPNIKVLILTAHGDDRAVIGAVMARASGYLLRGAQAQDLIDAVRKVAQGRSLLEPIVAMRVIERVRCGMAENEDCQLSELEHRILELVTQGKSDKEIATEASLSPRVVKSHIATIHGKLEIVRRSQSAAFSVTWRSRQTAD